MTARLLFVLALCLHLFADGLAIRDLRLDQLCADVVAALEAAQGDIQLHIAQARQHDLLGLGIVFQRQGMILVQQTVQSKRHLILFALALREHRHGEERLGERNGRVGDLALHRKGIVGIGAR